MTITYNCPVVIYNYVETDIVDEEVSDTVEKYFSCCISMFLKWIIRNKINDYFLKIKYIS